ncbi:MAG: DUF2868 domain-containing protein, partial [Planctomycetes bacterium]|nr:DUF2868 domain-containing protein [Planctomycetota bacterium]
LLTLAGLAFGAGAAPARLADDGGKTVDVLGCGAFFLLMQIALLVALVVFVLRAGRGAGPGLLHRPIAWLAQRFAGSGRGPDLAAMLRLLHARRGLYSDVERWTLFALAQRFGLAFNIGALLSALHAIVFTDLLFGWSTTLALEADTVHAIARALALPWSFLPSAVVDLDVVRASQWVRMPGEFVAETSRDSAHLLAAEWWRFLVAGLVAYGLLPRLVALVLGARLARRGLRRASLDHAGFQGLFDRMLPAGSGWRGPAPDSVVGPPPAHGRGPATAHPPAAPGAVTVAIAWGSLARDREPVGELVERRFGAPPRDVLPAGTAELAADAAAVEEVRSRGTERVAFLAAAGHQPTGDVLAFLRQLRSALATTVPIVVGLVELGSAGGGTDVDAEADERAAWRRALGALDDPYLWVEPIVGGPA